MSAGIESSSSTPAVIRAEQVFTRDAASVTRRIAGETVVLPMREDVVDLDALYTLNETGSFVWELIDGQRSVGALVEAMVEAYAVDGDLAAADIAHLVTSLRDEGLLRLAHG
jgi:hypothetical protein